MSKVLLNGLKYHKHFQLACRRRLASTFRTQLAQKRCLSDEGRGNSEPGKLSCKTLTWNIPSNLESRKRTQKLVDKGVAVKVPWRNQLRWYSDYSYASTVDTDDSHSESVPSKDFGPGNRTLIAKLLDLEEKDVLKVPKKEICESRASRTVDVLKKFGFSSSSVRMFPDLLIMNPGAVENYIRIMQESCYTSVRETFILRFRTLCKQPISVLQNKMLIPSVDRILEAYCTELELADTFLTHLIQTLPADVNQMSVYDLRSRVMSCYFDRLSLCTKEEGEICFQKYPRLYYRSFNWVKRAFKILKTLEFSNQKIKKNFYLMHADPDNLVRVLQIKSLGGMEVKKLCHSRPKVLMSSSDTLLSIEKSLADHGIPFSSVQKYPEVFTLAASTVQQRLHEIDTVPEFQLMKAHPRVARLLYYYNKAKSRLEEFRTMHVRVPSLHLLSTDDKRFNRSIASGDLRIRGVDAMIYLSQTFKVKRNTIREYLCCHPHRLHIPLVNVKSVLKYIQELGCFSDKQIIEAMPILLYPKAKVEKEFENVLKSGEASMSDDYFLQMVLYFLERPGHFTGDSVWLDKIVHDEEDGEHYKQP